MKSNSVVTALIFCSSLIGTVFAGGEIARQGFGDCLGALLSALEGIFTCGAKILTSSFLSAINNNFQKFSNAGSSLLDIFTGIITFSLELPDVVLGGAFELVQCVSTFLNSSRNSYDCVRNNLGNLTTTSTKAPTTNATKAPTTNSTRAPTTNSTRAPTTNATIAPTTNSTRAPTTNSTSAPTTNSTSALTTNSTRAPTTNSTRAPTTNSTSAPTTNSTRATRAAARGEGVEEEGRQRGEERERVDRERGEERKREAGEGGKEEEKGKKEEEKQVKTVESKLKKKNQVEHTIMKKKKKETS